MLWEKIRALIGALPAWLALVQSILTAVAVEVVPLLPDHLAVQVGSVLALMLGWVATAVRLVSRVTPVPAKAQGLVVRPDQELSVELRNAHTGRMIDAIVTTG